MWMAFAQTADNDFAIAIHPSSVGARELLIAQYPGVENYGIELKQMWSHGSAVMEDESYCIATWED